MDVDVIGGGIREIKEAVRCRKLRCDAAFSVDAILSILYNTFNWDLYMYSGLKQRNSQVKSYITIDVQLCWSPFLAMKYYFACKNPEISSRLNI